MSIIIHQRSNDTNLGGSYIVDIFSLYASKQHQQQHRSGCHQPVCPVRIIQKEVSEICVKYSTSKNRGNIYNFTLVESKPPNPSIAIIASSLSSSSSSSSSTSSPAATRSKNQLQRKILKEKQKMIVFTSISISICIMRQFRFF